jgi:hypothetical protein
VFGGGDKLELLTKALSSNAVLDIRGQRWGFYQLARIDELDGTYLTGVLVKYKPEDEEEVVVPEEHALADDSVQNRVTAKSRFFLHVHSGILAYHPIANRISVSGFRTRFIQVLENALGNFFVNAEIQPIGDDVRLLEQLRRFKTVRQVSISLHPSNPSSRDIWKRVDERLQDWNATSYHEKLECQPQKGSLHVVDDPEIASKIAMAQDGYGQAAVTGQLDGHERTVSTKDNPITVILSGYDDDHPEIAFPELRETFANLMRRFTK